MDFVGCCDWTIGCYRGILLVAFNLGFVWVMFKRKKTHYKYYVYRPPCLNLLDDPAEARRRAVEFALNNLGSQGWKLVTQDDHDNFVLMKESHGQ